MSVFGGKKKKGERKTNQFSYAGRKCNEREEEGEKKTKKNQKT